MKRKFKILKDGKEYKPEKGEMLTMNAEGVFYLISGLDEYYTNICNLYDKIGHYEVKWNAYSGDIKTVEYLGRRKLECKNDLS